MLPFKCQPVRNEVLSFRKIEKKAVDHDYLRNNTYNYVFVMRTKATPTRKILIKESCFMEKNSGNKH